MPFEFHIENEEDDEKESGLRKDTISKNTSKKVSTNQTNSSNSPTRK